MHCPTCGARNEDDARFCVNCGQKLKEQEAMYGGAPAYAPYGVPGGYPQHIPNYLVQAILVTIFCCLPLGIAAIIFAAQVNGKVAAGDITGAQSASRTARALVIVSVVAGVVVIGIVLLLGFGEGGSTRVDR